MMVGVKVRARVTVKGDSDAGGDATVGPWLTVTLDMLYRHTMTLDEYSFTLSFQNGLSMWYSGA
jgi:hypothetical protein